MQKTVKTSATDSVATESIPETGVTTKVGAPGFAIYDGFLVEDEANPKLTGTTKYATYSNILANVNIIGAGVRYFLNLVAKPPWKFEPADDTPQAMEMAERVTEITDGITTPWNRIVRRAAMYRFYGFSLQLWTAVKREDGDIGILDIEPRPQVTIERWKTDEFGVVEGVWQRSPQTQEEIGIPRSRLIYCVDDSLNDTPEGLGLFRHIVKTAEELQRLEQLEGFGFETDLRGIPVGKGPFAELQEMVRSGELTQAQADSMKQPLLDFMKAHQRTPQTGMLLDSIPYIGQDDAATPSTVKQWDLSLLTTNGTSLPDIAKAIERKNREIARVLGVEGLLLGATSHGSEALSRDKTHNFYLVVDSTLKEIVNAFEKDYLDRLFELNGWDEDLKPAIKVDSIQYRDVEQITKAMVDLASAGAPIMPDDPAVSEVYDMMGLTKPIIDAIRAAGDSALISDRNINPTEGNIQDESTESSQNRTRDE